jgi:hypothetical protein
MSATAPLQNLADKPKSLGNSVHHGLLLQRKCACGSPTSSLTGECAECKSKKRLQTKLTIGASNDPLEQEADRVADQVLAGPVRAAVNGTPPRIQRYSAQATQLTNTAPTSVDRVLSCAGRPLEPTLLRDMEHRFGHDFSQVRVHTGEAAERSARDVNANAYTVGHNIAFGAGRFAPETHDGRRLIAHELTHVVQQSELKGTDVEKDGAKLAPLLITATGFVQRKPADIEALIRNEDWSRAAWAIAQFAPAEMAARLSSMPAAQRRYLVEGARHGEGLWDIEPIVAEVYKISPRDAIIGSVRFFVWKHLWSKAGEYLCGLNDDDMRRVAIELRLTLRDMQVIVDERTDKTQAERLSLVLLGSLEVFKQAPQPLITGGEKIVESWLLSDPLVGPYAEARFKTGIRIVGHLHVIPADKWGDKVVKESAGRNNPETGKPQSADEARAQSWRMAGFYVRERGEIYVRQGEQWSTLIHEATHSIAADDFRALYGFSVSEGATEYFARHVARHASMHPGVNYREEQDGIAALARVVSDATLAKAFFTGDGYAVQNPVDHAKGQGTFSLWVAAMQSDDQRKSAPKILE